MTNDILIVNRLCFSQCQRCQFSDFVTRFSDFQKTSNKINFLSPIRTVIVSHMDVCKNKFTYHLSDKTHGFGGRFIHSGGASSVILRTRERAAHVASHMIVCCK